ncbi:hypothetical protein KP509_08G064900 [Ceratopteris richardii]|uniref:Uncharacterized protein n=1 Tax=Ceratopteris richardii TaxID=49495 RepID=A0A8T2U7F9_CERRI|nr:hypothetical protein KP509_08G064900 [Ceratopteris richardii]
MYDAPLPCSQKYLYSRSVKRKRRVSSSFWINPLIVSLPKVDVLEKQGELRKTLLLFGLLHCLIPRRSGFTRNGSSMASLRVRKILAGSFRRVASNYVCFYLLQ